jgi:hypothetical protein
MPISPISQVKTIAYKLDLTGDIKEIYSTSLVIGSEYVPGYKIISFNAFIKNLRAFASVESLPESSLPSFLPTDTSTDKTVKVLDIEWGSARKQLNLYIATNTGITTDWHQVGSLSMLNPYGYPFRVYNLMDMFTDNLAIELGENSKIGVQVQDVGYGLLVEQDNVTIHGSYTEELFVQTEDKQVINNYSFEIRNISTGGGSTTSPATPGTSQPINNSFSNSSLVSNTSSVGN